MGVHKAKGVRQITWSFRYFYGMAWTWGAWMRFGGACGPGLAIKSRRMPDLFSERHGYARRWRVGPVWVKLLPRRG
jgi:hypothetical protein